LLAELLIELSSGHAGDGQRRLRLAWLLRKGGHKRKAAQEVRKRPGGDRTVLQHLRGFAQAQSSDLRAGSSSAEAISGAIARGRSGPGLALLAASLELGRLA